MLVFSSQEKTLRTQEKKTRSYLVEFVRTAPDLRRADCQTRHARTFKLAHNLTRKQFPHFTAYVLTCTKVWGCFSCADPKLARLNLKLACLCVQLAYVSIMLCILSLHPFWMLNPFLAEVFGIKAHSLAHASIEVSERHFVDMRVFKLHQHAVKPLNR